jgi:hypothetical protein
MKQNAAVAQVRSEMECSPAKIEKAALILAFILVGTAVLHLSSEPRWEKFTAQAGSFSVFMPAKPKAENQSVTVNGVKMESYLFSPWSRSGAEFTLLC